MSSLLSVIAEIGAAVMVAAVPALLAYVIPLIQMKIHNERLARLAEGAANAAGRIVLNAVKARDTGSSLSIAELLTEGARAELPIMMERYADSLKKLASPEVTAMEIARDTLAAKIGDRANDLAKTIGDQLAPQLIGAARL